MSTRTSRREFQEELARRLQAAAQGTSIHSALGIASGQAFWLFDLAHAGAIVALPPLLSVPLTRHWFAGIANVRGVLYGVVDFSAFLGGEQTSRSGEARLLLIGPSQGSALLVDRALGLRSLAAMTEQSAQGRPARNWVGSDFRDERGQIWHTVNSRLLLADPDFLSIGLQ